MADKSVGNKIKKLAGTIRDFFFPMIDRVSKDELEKERERCCGIEKEITDYKFRDGEAELILKFADEYEKREDSRLHEVESKATVFIGAFSVAVTILMSLLKDFIFGSTAGLSLGILAGAPKWIKIAVPCLLGLAIFYLCFAIINSVKTLQRNTFSVLGVKETLNAGLYAAIILEGNKENVSNKTNAHIDNKKAELARKKLLYTFRNETVINRKVEHMTLAQDFFMHAVIVLILMLILLAIYLVWQKAGNCIVDIWEMIVATVNARP